MSLCLSTGLPHVGDACSKCIRVDEIARQTREDRRVVAAHAVEESAWIAMNAGRRLPLPEWLKLEAAWRSKIDEDRVVFSRVWAEKAEEYDRDNEA